VNTLSLSAIIVYIIAAISQIRLLLQNITITSQKHLLLLLGTIAFILHGILLYQNILTTQGIDLGFFNSASLIAWVTVMLLLLSLPQKPVDNLIIFLFPLAALTIGLDYTFQTERLLSSGQLGVNIHIISSILAYSLLTISALQSLFLAVQEQRLHNHHPGWIIHRLPPLQVMETLLLQLIELGVLLLTISLITGAIFLENIFQQHLIHKTVLSTIAWGVYIILLWGRWQYGWRGKVLIRWNLIGFLVLMLAYFGSKLVLELILHRQ